MDELDDDDEADDDDETVREMGVGRFMLEDIRSVSIVIGEHNGRLWSWFTLRRPFTVSCDRSKFVRGESSHKNLHVYQCQL